MEALATLDKKTDGPLVAYVAAELHRLPGAGPEEVNQVSMLKRILALERKFNTLEDGVSNNMIQVSTLSEKLKKVQDNVDTQSERIEAVASLQSTGGGLAAVTSDEDCYESSGEEGDVSEDDDLEAPPTELNEGSSINAARTPGGDDLSGHHQVETGGQGDHNTAVAESVDQENGDSDSCDIGGQDDVTDGPNTGSGDAGRLKITSGRDGSRGTGKRNAVSRGADKRNAASGGNSRCNMGNGAASSRSAGSRASIAPRRSPSTVEGSSKRPRNSGPRRDASSFSGVVVGNNSKCLGQWSRPLTFDRTDKWTLLCFDRVAHMAVVP
jgi:hypothetical protein